VGGVGVLVLILIIVAASSGGHTPTEAPSSSGGSTVSDKLDPTKVGLYPVKSDVDPCNDFYSYACGQWSEDVVLADNESYTSMSFHTLFMRNERELAKLLSADHSSGYFPQVSEFFASCMNEDRLDEVGIAPLQDVVAELLSAGSIETKLAWMHRHRFGALFSVYPQSSPVDPSMPQMSLGVGGLGLPTKSYYLPESRNSSRVQAYVRHLDALAALMTTHGNAQLRAVFAGMEKVGETVLDLESRIGGAQWAPEEARIPQHEYDQLGFAAVRARTPAFDWQAYATAAGIDTSLPSVQSMSMREPRTLLDALQTLLVDSADTSAPQHRTLTAYLVLRVANSLAPFLSSPFRREFLDYGNEVKGRTEDLGRFYYCLGWIESSPLGMILSQLFVLRHFTHDQRAAAEDLVTRVQSAFGRRLDASPWLDAESRAGAHDKLAKMTNHIGFPDNWPSAEGLALLHSDSLATNVMALRAFETSQSLADLAKPVDKSRWYMLPHEVNAYYDPLVNTIIFPAGILQPPFFDVERPAAANYGGIGAVIGHENCHGFDDEGSQFDGDGRLRKWWSNASRADFEERISCVADVYQKFAVTCPSTYCVTKGEHEKLSYQVNPLLTMGENLADVGGLQAVYDAYQKHKEDDVKFRVEEARRAHEAGFESPEQVLFTAYAQTWCSQGRPESYEWLVKSNPHAPENFRVQGPLSQLPAFSQAFQCKPGDAYAMEKPCSVW
jgi:predicted metalloendopeptidase